MINKISYLLTSNAKFDSVIEFVLRVIYNRPKTKRTLGDARYAKLFVKVKGKNRKFSDNYWLPPGESSLKMKIKRALYVTQDILNATDFFFHEKLKSKASSNDLVLFLKKYKF